MRNQHSKPFRPNLTGFLNVAATGWLVIQLVAAPVSTAVAQQLPNGHVQATSPIETIAVPLNKSRIIEVAAPVKKISVGNPDIADILILRANQVYVIGKKLGTTNVVLWDNRNRVVSTIDIDITHDVQMLKTKLFDVLPGERIRVHSSQGSIILGGEVSSLANIDAAMALAYSFAPKDQDGKAEAGSVVNLMHVGGVQQVMLEVKVAEINRTVFKELGIDFRSIRFGNNWKIGAVNGGATFPPALDPDGLKTPIFGALTPDSGLIGPALSEFEPDPLRIDDKGFLVNFLNKNFFFEAVINASKNNGLAKILAEPTLTALTGQEATFLSGGEFPIPVPQDNGNTTIEYKEFGIGLNFVPVVLESNHINLSVGIRVDELTSVASLILGVDNTLEKFFVPALKSRRATSSLELADGQTIAIAGLISDNLRENVDKFPGIGELPVLGLLFTSEEFQKDQTELVIFVTPRLARPLPSDEIRLPTDNFVEPNDIEFYLMGRMEGRKPRTLTISPAPAEKSGSEGSYGHQL